MSFISVSVPLSKQDEQKQVSIRFLEVDPQIYSSLVKITTLRVVQLIDGSIVHLKQFIGLSSISNSVGSELSAFHTVKWH